MGSCSVAPSADGLSSPGQGPYINHRTEPEDDKIAISDHGILGRRELGFYSKAEGTDPSYSKEGTGWIENSLNWKNTTDTLYETSNLDDHVWG